jgi:hypothetical protein
LGKGWEMRVQTTPTELGKVLWRGGPGRVGSKGGWGYRCNFCNIGDRRGADPRRSVSDTALFAHLAEKHPGELKRFTRIPP